MKYITLIFLLALHLNTIAQAPLLGGTKVIGNHPNTPLLFTIPASGLKPMLYEAIGLPNGLNIDANTGFITGTVKEAGEYKVKVTVSNAEGKVSEEIKIVIGDKLCLTPALGWNSWNVFTRDISEKMLMEIADAMVSNGMRDLGYQYINIDDYWHATEREMDGRPKADPAKFPHGMKYLADYVHSRGLKLGIYSCAGDKTCGKCFGGYQHEDIDAKTYAEWGIDLLKYDYCFAPWGQKAAIERYTKMGTALKNSGRSIVFSICEWGIRKPWKWAASTGGSYWRSTPDIMDTWSGGTPWQMGVTNILHREQGKEQYAGPGHWNDPDMLLVGNHGQGKATGGNGKFTGMTQEEYKTHFALWCMLAAPLLTSCDLRSVSKEDLALMTNRTLLAINQDPLGEQAKIIKKDDGLWFYKKNLADGRVAIAVFNSNEEDGSYTLNLKALGLNPNSKAVETWNFPQNNTTIAIPSHATQIQIFQ